MEKLRGRVNGSMPIWISIIAMLVSIIVGVTTILGNPFQAVTRTEVKSDLTQMEVRLNKRIDEIRQDIRDYHNGRAQKP